MSRLQSVEHPIHKWHRYPGASSPGDVKSGYRIPMPFGATIAALCPAHNWSQIYAFLLDPGPFFSSCELHVGFGPTLRPQVLIVQPVKLCTMLPIRPGKVKRITNSQAALFRSINEKQSPKRPVSLAAEITPVFLIQDSDSQSCIKCLGRCNQPGQSSTHDDHSALFGTQLHDPTSARKKFTSFHLERTSRWAMPPYPYFPQRNLLTSENFRSSPPFLFLVRPSNL